jgi:hypothetical protein
MKKGNLANTVAHFCNVKLKMNPSTNLAGIGFLGGSNQGETIKYFKLNYFRFRCKGNIEAHLTPSSLKMTSKKDVPRPPRH